jgi:rod shape-determining protein MreC
MKSSSLITILIFGVLILLILVLPPSAKQQLQAKFYQAISPILRTGAAFQAQLGGVSGGLKHLDELERENRQLKTENEGLRTTNNLLVKLESEVNRLNQALGFKQKSPFNLLPAHVISRENATWWSSCTIDRGSDNGIAPDTAVVTEDGLVGKVTTVGKDVSVILLISDESLRVSVAIEGTQEKGIISGTRTSSLYQPDLKIRFLSKTADIKPGAKVFTAGAGGVFPSGVLIGRVEKFQVDQLDGVATVRPAVDIANVQDVFVISGSK